MLEDPRLFEAYLTGDIQMAKTLNWSRDQARPALSIPEVVDLVGAPLSPLPWDDHQYMYVPPPELPLQDLATYALIKGIKELIRRNGGRDEPTEGNFLPLEENTYERKSRQKKNGYAGRLELAAAMGLKPIEQVPAWLPGQRKGFDALMPGGDKHELWKDNVVFDRPLAMLQAWLEACGIRYFSAKELTGHWWRKPWDQYVVPGIHKSSWSYVHTELRIDFICKRIGLPLPQYIVPMPNMWPRILPVLILLDRFRHWLRGPVTISSAYRCPAYNNKPRVGWLANAGPEGARDSRHMSFEACDFRYRDRDPREGREGQLDPKPFIDFYDALYRHESDGIGFYNSFFHLDRYTRGAGSGKASRWSQRTHPGDARIKWMRGSLDTITSRR